MARIATVEEFAPYVGVTDLGRVDLTVLQGMLDAAEQIAERYARLLFSPDPPLDVDGEDLNDPVERTFLATGKYRIHLPGLRAIETIDLDGLSLLPNYAYWIDLNDVEPAREIILSHTIQPVLGGAGVVTIAGRWGYNPSPPDAKDAILRLASRMYRERDASYADTVQNMDGSVTAFFRQLPVTVKQVLDSYRTPRFAIV